MQNKELNVLDIPKWGRYLRGKWIESFAANLTIEERKEIYMDQFLWHLCSYEKVECLEKEEAISAFEKKNKKQCTIFYQFSDDAYLVQHAKNLSVQDLPRDEWNMDYQDLYVMDQDHQWTFIITHENDWLGPYFIEMG
ncbi:DUF4275 family protein [Sporosarcina sp. GW1-11]|uniref:DUF4275 family protein n=1 Tax=Sporosarcina sp. GW1-11 TaxID=2899126 RepID=UPI00294E5D97|nr:DUF4275 family protein [Sporosarcina sp. GW1-11]MDV6377864.1 DUF4275 family protein [Sporosarcina sp. GW1-11]